MLLATAIDVQKRMIAAMQAQYDAETDEAKKLRISERIISLNMGAACMALVEGTTHETIVNAPRTA